MHLCSVLSGIVVLLLVLLPTVQEITSTSLNTGGKVYDEVDLSAFYVETEVKDKYIRAAATLDPNAAEDAAARILDRLDASSAEPDVVLLSARARLQLAILDETHVEPARALIERLVKLSIQQDGRVGWGLSYAWDAFQDGTTNPESTIYSYTTAAAAHALMDAYEVLGEERWLEWAQRAGEALMVDTCCSAGPDGLSVWYSNQGNDQQNGRQVHNVTGLTLGVLARLAEHEVVVGNPGAADRMADLLVARQGQGWSRPEYAAKSNWSYMDGGNQANDLIHEAFIVDGLLWYGGPEAVSSAMHSLAGIWDVHFDAMGVPNENPHTLGSNAWGPPAGLYVLTGVDGFEKEASLVAEQLVPTVGEEGWPTSVDPDHVRGAAWYALSLGRFAAVEQGKRKLLPMAVR